MYETTQPSLWIRRSVFGAAGEGIEDTNDSWIKLHYDEDGASGRLYCYGCREIQTVTLVDPDARESELAAECVNCGRTYKVEVG